MKSKMTPQNRKEMNSQIIKGLNKIKSNFQHSKKKKFLLDMKLRCMEKKQGLKGLKDLKDLKDFVINRLGYDKKIFKSNGKNALKIFQKIIKKIPEDDSIDIVELLSQQKEKYIKSIIHTSKLSVNVLLLLGIIYFISMINLYSRRREV